MSRERVPWLRQPLTGGWVFRKRSWFLFFLREITCVFVGIFAFEYLFFVRAVAKGPEAYQRCLDWFASGPVVAFHVIALVALLWHTVTWFVAAPKALRPRVGDRPVPPTAIVGGHYALWLVCSVVLFWLLA